VSASAASVFETTCEELARQGGLDGLSARGTVRLALKAAGLDARSVTSGQMRVVLEKVMPAELAARGVPEPGTVCRGIAARISALEADGARPRSSVEDVFRRLGGV